MCLPPGPSATSFMFGFANCETMIGKAQLAHGAAIQRVDHVRQFGGAKAFDELYRFGPATESGAGLQEQNPALALREIGRGRERADSATDYDGIVPIAAPRRII